MSYSMPIPMEGRALPSEFNLGPFHLTNADQFPLSELYCNVQEHEISMRLSAEFPSSTPWRGHAMVVLFMYRLPEAAERFQEEVADYRKKAKSKVKLPERKLFEESDLAVPTVSDDWVHDCFAAGNRNLFHLYTSDDAGVMIRLSSQKGTMLDHPLLKLVMDNISLVPGQWVAEAPSTRQASGVLEEEAEAGVQVGNEGITEIDLRKEYAAMLELLKTRVAAFDPKANFGPGEGETVSSIEVAYDFSQGGWVTVVFDTRPEVEPDGEWTLFLDEEQLEYRDHWPACAEALFEGGEVTVILRDGQQRTLSGDGDELGELLGITLKEALLDAKTSGVFDSLPRSPACYLGVEDLQGSYGWPAYEDREAEGRL